MSPGARSAPGSARALWAALRRSRVRGGPKTSDLLKALPRMVAASASGRYTGCSRGKLALMVAAAGYVVSPVDLLPEGLLGPIGLADDAAVLAWLAGALLAEGEAFLAWEREQAGGPAAAGPAQGPAGRFGARVGGLFSGLFDGGAGGGAAGGAAAGGGGAPSGPAGTGRDRRDGGPDVVQGDVIS